MYSATILVPEDYATIQGAIDYSVDGDTVIVSPGEYEENLNFNGKNIILSSEFIFNQDDYYIENTIIGTQTYNGDGQIVQLIYDGTATQVTNLVIPGMHGETLDINYYSCP